MTAFAGDAQGNVDFYTLALGLRLVKKTVNFDDPNTYHLYYGDSTGSPGTIMTFFPWTAEGKLGHPGSGQAISTAFDVPRASLDYWKRRLRDMGLVVHGPAERFDETVLLAADQDGLEVEIVGRDDVGEGDSWKGSDVPDEHAIRRIGGVTLLLSDSGPTVELAEGLLGFTREGHEGPRMRYLTGGSRVDLISAPDRNRGAMGVGAVHHVAWRVEDDDAQVAALGVLRGEGLRATDVQDRQYFRSIYFREPGGVLFEVATDSPGFGVDEGEDDLGSSLRLPPWLEGDRQSIESNLPVVSVRT